MFKKILLVISAILLGLNFGLVAGLSPIVLLFTMVLFPEDALNETVMTVTSIISAVISGISTYVYIYKKKREHESPNLFGTTLAVSFAIGAILMAVFLFIYMGDPNNGLSNRLL